MSRHSIGILTIGNCVNIINPEGAMLLILLLTFLNLQPGAQATGKSFVKWNFEPLLAETFSVLNVTKDMFQSRCSFFHTVFQYIFLLIYMLYM